MNLSSFPIGTVVTIVGGEHAGLKGEVVGVTHKWLEVSLSFNGKPYVVLYLPDEVTV